MKEINWRIRMGDKEMYKHLKAQLSKKEELLPHLTELKGIYEDKLKAMQDCYDRRRSYAIYYMKDFINLCEEQDELKEKLDELNDKIISKGE